MRPFVTRIGCVLFGLLLSGCLAAQEPARLESAESPVPTYDPREPIAFGEEQGAIVGVVVDDQYLPVLGANVTLFGEDKNVRSIVTNEEGGFQFNNVPAGKQTLVAEAEGYEPGARGLEVRAGFVERVSLLLVPVPPLFVPYREERPAWRGYIGCSIGLGSISTVDLCANVDKNSNASIKFPWGRFVNAMHWEMHWQRSSILSAKLLNNRLITPIGYGAPIGNLAPEKQYAYTFCDGYGESPVVVTCQFKMDDAVNTYWNWDGKSGLEGWMDVRSRGNASTPNANTVGTWINQHSGPIMQQHFSVYVTLFHGGEPVPAGYRNSPDR